MLLKISGTLCSLGGLLGALGGNCFRITCSFLLIRRVSRLLTKRGGSNATGFFSFLKSVCPFLVQRISGGSALLQEAQKAVESAELLHQVAARKPLPTHPQEKILVLPQMCLFPDVFTLVR